MKKWEQRREILLKELSRQGKLSTLQVKELLNISESTARRFIVELEQDHCVIRCFGGIQKIEPSTPKYSYQNTHDLHSENKMRIGLAAAGLVEDDDVIFLSGGSTVKCMAQTLRTRLQNQELRKLSVITNSLVSAEVLADYADVIMPGGIYRSSLQVLDGSLSEKNIRNMHFTKAFLGAMAINSSDGFMTSNLTTNSIDEIVLSKTSFFYVLADSSKFDRHSLISYAPLNAAAGIITDSDISSALLKNMQKQGANIIIS